MTTSAPSTLTKVPYCVQKMRPQDSRSIETVPGTPCPAENSATFPSSRTLTTTMTSPIPTSRTLSRSGLHCITELDTSSAVDDPGGRNGVVAATGRPSLITAAQPPSRMSPIRTPEVGRPLPPNLSVRYSATASPSQDAHASALEPVEDRHSGGLGAPCPVPPSDSHPHQTEPEERNRQAQQEGGSLGLHERSEAAPEQQTDPASDDGRASHETPGPEAADPGFLQRLPSGRG